jgi:uncharacterized protein YkwD
VPRTFSQAIGFLIGFWLALALSPLWVGSARADGPGSFVALERDLLEAVNRVRSEHHLIPLARRPDLDRIARAHSDDMARRHYFAHETPEGVNPLQRIETAHLDMTLAAENLGKTDQADPNPAIVREWLRSPIHRRNLLAPVFNHTGIGISRGTDGALLYTQVYVTLPRRGDARP